MQDRPVIQHELASRLANITHLLDGPRAIEYGRTFWQTMNREWSGIDKHRLDKFYALMRYFLAETLVLAKNRQWASDTVDAITAELQGLPLSPDPTVFKRGVQFHVLDIYLEELEKACPSFLVTVRQKLSQITSTTV